MKYKIQHYFLFACKLIKKYNTYSPYAPPHKMLPESAGMTIKPFFPAPPPCSQGRGKTLEVPLHNVGRDLGRGKLRKVR